VNLVKAKQGGASHTLGKTLLHKQKFRGFCFFFSNFSRLSRYVQNETTKHFSVHSTIADASIAMIYFE